MYNHILHYANAKCDVIDVKKKVFQAIAEKFISDWSTAITVWKDYFAESITLAEVSDGLDFYTSCCKLFNKSEPEKCWKP